MNYSTKRRRTFAILHAYFELGEPIEPIASREECSVALVTKIVQLEISRRRPSSTPPPPVSASSQAKMRARRGRGGELI